MIRPREHTPDDPARRPRTPATWALVLLAALPLGCPTPEERGDWAQVAVSECGYFACGIKTDGRLVCWGYDPYDPECDEWDPDCYGYGQVREAPSIGTATQVTAGCFFGCVLYEPGPRIACWGDGTEGQLDVPDGYYLGVSAGNNHTCGIRQNDRSVDCWGADWGDVVDWIEQDLHGLSVNSLHSYGTETCAIDEGGRITCGGSSSDPIDGRFLDVGVGYNHACAVRRDGKLECWGDASDETLEAPDGSFQAVSSGENFSCAIAEDGSLECWGGVYTHFKLDVVTDAPQDIAFQQISAGSWSACGTTTNNDLVCWPGTDLEPPGE